MRIRLFSALIIVTVVGCTAPGAMASCSRGSAFVPLKNNLSPNEPIILTAASLKVARALVKQEFTWVDEQEHTIDLAPHQILNSRFIYLLPPDPEAGHAYKLRNQLKRVCQAGAPPDSDDLCLNYKHFPESNDFHFHDAEPIQLPSSLRLEEVRVFHGVLGHNSDLHLSITDPSLRLPPLLVVSNYLHDVNMDIRLFSAPEWNAEGQRYVLESGLHCDPSAFRLFFLESSEIRIYAIQKDGLHRLAGWRITLPPPLGVTKKHFLAVSAKYDQAVERLVRGEDPPRKVMYTFANMQEKGGMIPAKYLKVVDLNDEEMPDFAPW